MAVLLHILAVNHRAFSPFRLFMVFSAPSSRRAYFSIPLWNSNLDTVSVLIAICSQDGGILNYLPLDPVKYHVLYYIQYGRSFHGCMRITRTVRSKQIQ